MITLLCALLGLLYTDFVGYFVHKLLHSGKIDFLYKLHMEHHITQYPPCNLRSIQYRTTPQKKILGAGPEWALPIGSVMILTAIVMLATGVPLLYMSAFYGAALVYALIAYSWLHDQFHLIKNVNKKAWFFRMRHLHDVHHHNMKKNYGIGSYWLDKLLRTYDDKQLEKVNNKWTI